MNLYAGGRQCDCFASNEAAVRGGCRPRIIRLGKPCTAILRDGNGVAPGRSFTTPSVALQSIIEADADAFKQYLIQEDLAMATIAKRLQLCRIVFKAAMRAKYISSNPLQGVSALATVKAEGFFFITREMTQRLLDACPNVTWKLFVALGRYGGFRVPSEACSLRWQDVLWDQDKS
jgi:integrase